jgi:prepilin-type N-terminal cleavage/methylation domain-containing protein
MKKGFSLAELMIAIGILGIGMLIIAAAFPVAIDQSREAIELRTSELVFKEAVNTLKTKTDWAQAERMMADPAPGAILSGTGLFVVDFIQGIKPNYFPRLNRDSAGGVKSDLVYSQDSSYGWICAVEKVANTTMLYKYWIFVIREPKGMEDASGFKFQWAVATASPNLPTVAYQPPPFNFPPPTQTLNVNRLAGTPDMPRGGTFLSDTGSLYKVNDTGAAMGPGGADIPGMYGLACNQPVSDRIDINDPSTSPHTQIQEVGLIAYPYSTRETTRKNPVVAVFQATIGW